MKFINLIFILTALPLTSFCQSQNWTNLLDKELSQWDNYLSYCHQVGYDGTVPKDRNGVDIDPIGVNSDTYGVFTTNETDHETTLRISGEIYGCLYTKKEYQNYHLKLLVKWGDIKWDPRKDLLKDSGILYHSVGKNGADHWRSWMMSQEFQIMEGHMGDYWNLATSAIDIRAYTAEYIMPFVADTSQPFQKFGTDPDDLMKAYCMRSNNYERPHSEWNTMELICIDGKSLHIVNGEVVMILQNSRYIKDGQAIPLVKGKIQLQSEAAEVFYKDIMIRPLDTMPSKYEALFD